MVLLACAEPSHVRLELAMRSNWARLNCGAAHRKKPRREPDLIACRQARLGSASGMAMDSARARSLYMLMATVAFGYGAIAALLTQYGAGFMPQAVLLLLAVALMAGLIVFRRNRPS